MTARLTESTVEEAALEWLEGLGYQVHDSWERPVAFEGVLEGRQVRA